MWSATCSWRSSQRLHRAGVARAPSNLRCGPGTVTSDGITDVVQRVPVTCEESAGRDRKGQLAVVEGVRRHLLSHDGRWQLSLSQKIRRKGTHGDNFFFCVHPCSARTSEHLENGIGRGVTNCMTCTEAVSIVGFSLLGRCSELRAQKEKNKSFTSYETCASMFITSERSGRNCLRFNIVAWQKHFRSVISRSMSLRYAVVPL